METAQRLRRQELALSLRLVTGSSVRLSLPSWLVDTHGGGDNPTRWHPGSGGVAFRLPRGLGPKGRSGTQRGGYGG